MWNAYAMDTGVTISTIFVGLATVAAAVAAWKATLSADAVLHQAERQATAGEQLEVTARLDLEASKHPLIVDIPRDPFNLDAPHDAHQRVLVDTKGSTAITITAPIRNIGRGPAFLLSAKVVPFGIEHGRVHGDGFDANPAAYVLPSGETTLVAARVTLGEDAYVDMDAALRTQFQVFVRYTDREAEQHRETIFDVTPEVDGSGYAVTGVSVNNYDEAWRTVVKQVSVRRVPVVAKEPTVDDAMIKGAKVLGQAAEIMGRRQEEWKQRHPIRPLSPDILRLAALGRSDAMQRATVESLQNGVPDASGADPDGEVRPDGRSAEPVPSDEPVPSAEPSADAGAF
jgi:hypothetical protein